jgi:type IV pilus assembly protein PilY1
MFTDGVWEDSFGLLPGQINRAVDAPWLGNNDGTSTPLPADRHFSAEELADPVASYDPRSDDAEPYSDSNTYGLADLVFHSWVTDLRPLENGAGHRVATLIADPTVPPGHTDKYVFWNPANDPADWQHITTFSVGLGVSGEISYPSGDYATTRNIETDGFPGAWEGGASARSGRAPSSAQKVDDLWHAGLNGRGGYSSAQNPAELIESFQRVMDTVSQVAKKQASGSAPSFNSGSAATTRMAFQAKMHSQKWTGDLLAYRVSGGPGMDPCPQLDIPKGELCEKPGTDYYWSAAAELGDPAFDWQVRRVATGTATYADGVKSNRAVALNPDGWPELADGDKRALLGLTQLAALPADDSPGVARAFATMEYVAGRRDYELNRREPDAPYTFRDRDCPPGIPYDSCLLGDIARAGPVVVATPHRSFGDAKYLAYAQRDRNRTELVYVGANDGMLHAFDLDSGEERLAYVPRPVLGKLATLTEPGYGSDPAHTNFVDGAIAEGDAYFAGVGEWTPVVAGGLGLGAQAVYAIRSPSLLAGEKAEPTDVHLWDFTDRDDPDLGFVLGKPAIVRVLMNDGSIKWVAVFGNGYNSSVDDSAQGGRRALGCDDATLDYGSFACARAVLFVVDIETGRLVAKLDTLKGRKDDPNHVPAGEAGERAPNGLGEPKVLGRVLVDGEGNALGGGDPIATIAYAGDLQGNLWRFDLTGLNAQGTTGKEPTLVFSAASSDSKVQPITAGIEVAPHPTGVGTIVLFGTGRYFSLVDSSDTSMQTFYGIWDRGGDGSISNPLVQRANLLVQQIELTDERVGDADAKTLGRTSSTNPVDWAVHQGWLLDLIETENNLSKGERVVSSAQVRGDRVVFVSLIPETDTCRNGGISWVNALNYTNGAALDETPFDYDLNGAFDTSDLLMVGQQGTAKVGSSIRLANSAGIYSGPATLPLIGGETKSMVATSDGDLIDLLESSAIGWRVYRQIQ